MPLGPTAGVAKTMPSVRNDHIVAPVAVLSAYKFLSLEPTYSTELSAESAGEERIACVATTGFHSSVALDPASVNAYTRTPLPT